MKKILSLLVLTMATMFLFASEETGSIRCVEDPDVFGKCVLNIENELQCRFSLIDHDCVWQ
jgi:hypothetical protein